MQEFAQKISNKFGVLPDGIDVKFWYNGLAFTEKCLSYVDDKIHAGGSFQRADVAALTADDTALHLVAGQGHHADGGLAAVVGSAAADGLTDDLFGVSSLRTNPFQRESWQA